MTNNRKDIEAIVSILLILLLVVIIMFDTGGELMNVVRIGLGSVVLLFLPGRWVTKAAFPRREIDLLERVALSFALSIAVIPLVVFYANLSGVRITEMFVLSVVLGVVLLCMMIWINRLQKMKKKI